MALTGAPATAHPTTYSMTTRVTLLHEAARAGDVAAIRRLLEAGVAVDSVGKNGWTPLHLAAYSGHIQAIRVLLGAGAAIGSVANNKWTPLHYAAYSGHTDIIWALLGGGAAIDSLEKNGWTPLHLAAYTGHVDAIRVLVAAGAAVDCLEKDEWTPLHLAAQNGHSGAIRALLCAGAAVNSKTHLGSTPLYFAARDGHVDAIQALLSAGAGLNCKDNGGRTPLELAREGKHTEAVRVLQEAAEAEAHQQLMNADRQRQEAERQHDAEQAAAEEARLRAAVSREVGRLQEEQQLKEQEAQRQLAALQEELARLRASADELRPDLEDSALERSPPGKGGAPAMGMALNTPLYSVVSPVPLQGRAGGTRFNTPVYSVPPESSASLCTPASQPDPGLASCELAESEVVLVEKLGQGSFGEVWRGQWYGSDVAVKKLRAEAAGALPAEVLASLRQESTLMASLRHDRIVGLRGVCFDPPLIVMELCGRKALDTVLQAANCDLAAAQKLTWPRRLGILVDVAWGMAYLHSRHVLHRDLKSPNILVDDNWRAKVADFNLSKLMEIRVGSAAASSRARSTYSSINPRWLAPELVLEGDDGTHAHATPSSDCFAFGLVMWEVLVWQYPWANLNETQIVGRLYQHRRPPIPDRSQLPGPNSGSWVGLDSFISLMQRCWDDDPAARPSFNTVATELQGLLG